MWIPWCVGEGRTMKDITVFTEDFSLFGLGAFPYDPEHSAMGEYHFYPEKGYKGRWFDPIADWEYKGPSWLVTDPLLDGRHMMEQMRMVHPQPKKAVPILRTGETYWTDYTASVTLRALENTEICGIAFRYQTSMMHYGFYLVKNGVEVHRVNKLERSILAKKPYAWSCDDFITLSVTCKENEFSCKVNGEEVISFSDSTFKNGCIALCACMPTQYESATVTMHAEDWDEQEKKQQKKAMSIAEKAERVPQPILWKTYDLKDFGAGREIRFGHLTGTKELFFLICQHQRRVYKDRYPFISCMTAVSFETGKVLWQIGEPHDDDDVIMLTTDLPFQVYDIDGDGTDEVICSWDFKVMILDGPTGKIRKSMPSPLNSEPPESVTGLEFGKYAFSRLNVDAIRIVNVSGNSRPSDILIKDRYSRLWVYDKDFNLIWKFSKYNTGHFPYGYDFDHDGKDEIYSCYNMVDHDGKLEWSLPIRTDHTDEIIIGKFDPDAGERIAIVSGWEGFMLLDTHGNILKRDINGHGQRISVGNYLPERKGLEICTTTYWGNNGIIYMHDCEGKELWHKEMLCNGNIIAPINWDGSGQDLILLNADAKDGGLMDGNGDVVVRLPDDGHPVLSCEVLDVTGDNREEILCWDRKSLWVYTQDRPLEPQEKGTYTPEKYAVYNASDYRGEYSFPHWN